MAGVMAAWGRALGLSGTTTVLTSPAAIADLPQDVATAFGFGGWIDGDNPVVTEAQAMNIPSVRRGRQVITSVMAQMPLQAVREPVGQDGRPVPGPTEVRVVRRDLLAQPELAFPYALTMAWTVHHLLLQGVAWWEVTERDFDGFPKHVRHIAPTRVAISGGRVQVDGVTVEDRDVIRFDSPVGGLLHHAKGALNLALGIQSTARALAKPTAPMTILRDTRTADDEPLSATERETLLSEWEAARARRAVAYVPPSVEVVIPQWNAGTIGLKDAREQAAIDIARALNLDPRWVSAPSADSLTYTTTRESRSELVSITCAPIMLAIAQRLSMPDVTPLGQRVRFDTDAVLAGHGRDRIDDAAAAAGVAPLTRDEARARHLGLPPAPEPPAPDPEPQEDPVPDDRPGLSGVTINLAARKAEQPAPEVDGRIVSGVAIPWGHNASSALGLVRFARGSVAWGEHPIPVLLDHDRGQPAGVVLSLEEDDVALTATIRLDEGERGDDVLARLTSGSRGGLSAGLELGAASADRLRRTKPGTPVDADGRIREISVVAVPAFEGARLNRPESAPAAANYAGSPVGAAPGLTPLGGPVSTTLTDAPTILELSPMVPLADTLTMDAVATTTDAAKTKEPAKPVEPEPVEDPAKKHEVPPVPAAASPDGQRLSLSARPLDPYRSGQRSLVLDAYASQYQGDSEARTSLEAYHRDALELAVAVRSGYDTEAEGYLIREGYRGDILIPAFYARRPITGALSNRVALTDATPFVIPTEPVFGDVAAHTEGTAHAAEGALTLASVTVTPRVISGAWRASRELLDAANPAIEPLALNAMRNDYAVKSEAYAISRILSGLTATVTATNGANALETAILTFSDNNVRPPVVFASTTLFNDLALMKLSSGENRYPLIAPSNRQGTTDGPYEMNIQGARVIKAPGMVTRTAALVNPDEIMWAESGVAAFRFDQPEGPGIIKLAIWAYQACQVLASRAVVYVSLTAV